MYMFAHETGTDDFGLATLSYSGVQGASPGQTSIKCCDLACDVEPLPLKNYKHLTMKLEVKYLFPTSFSGANFNIHQFPEGLEMRPTAPSRWIFC